MMSSEHTMDERATKTPPKAKPPAPEKSTASGDAPATISRLQQTVGNAAVQRLLARRDGGPSEVDDETAATIHAARGEGHTLRADVAAQAGQVMDQDFSAVHVHTDQRADQLSRQLGATAFTTGNDIFFRAGAYDPAGHSGRRLIAHELTHVAQQGAAVPAVQGKMAVNDPHDQFEAEADRVAAAVVASDAAPVQRQTTPLEEEEPVQRQADVAPEEEETAEVQMQEEDELEEEGG